jgi:hypothetical protein
MAANSRQDVSMWLYRHHTCNDLIDLDHETRRWRPIDDSEKPAGAKVLADLPVRGSYELDGERRFFKYWTDDERLVFRTPEGKTFELCRKLADGSTLLPAPELRIVVKPAVYSNGNSRVGYNQVTVEDAQGTVLYETSYHAEPYVRLYASDITASSAIDTLADWDFFVALQGAAEAFAQRAAGGVVPLTLAADGSAAVQGGMVRAEDLTIVSSGDTCPRSGIWAVVSDLRGLATLTKGAVVPQHKGQDVQWVWSRAA